MLSSIAWGWTFWYQQKQTKTGLTDCKPFHHFKRIIQSISMEVPKHFQLPFCIQYIDTLNHWICQNMQPLKLCPCSNTPLDISVIPSQGSCCVSGLFKYMTSNWPLNNWLWYEHSDVQSRSILRTSIACIDVGRGGKTCDSCLLHSLLKSR